MSAATCTLTGHPSPAVAHLAARVSSWRADAEKFRTLREQAEDDKSRGDFEVLRRVALITAATLEDEARGLAHQIEDAS